jgi:hypothetical protein
VLNEQNAFHQVLRGTPELCTGIPPVDVGHAALKDNAVDTSGG